VNEKRGWIWCFLLCWTSCSLSVTTFVPRLTSLAWFSLGPAQYRRWAIIQLAFVTNMVLVHSLFQPTYSSTYLTMLDRVCCCGTDTLHYRLADLLVAVPSCWAR
jgi:hypothetical protein